MSEFDEIKQVASKYGWSAVRKAGVIELYNTNNNPVCQILIGKRYKFLDMGGATLLSGRGQIEKSTIRVIENYFYAKKIII